MIDSPRTGHIPVEGLTGIDVSIKSLRFTGTPNASFSQLIQLGEPGATLARDITIDRIVVDDGAYVGGIIAINAPDCVIGNIVAGPQGGSSTAALVLIQGAGDRAAIKKAHFRSAKYHGALYSVSGTPANIKRSHTSYTLDPTNPAAASRSAAWIALAGKYEVDNSDF